MIEATLNDSITPSARISGNGYAADGRKDGRVQIGDDELIDHRVGARLNTSLQAGLHRIDITTEDDHVFAWTDGPIDHNFDIGGLQDLSAI